MRIKTHLDNTRPSVDKSVPRACHNVTVKLKLIFPSEGWAPGRSPVIVVSEVEPVQSPAEQEGGQGGSQKEPQDGHGDSD